MRSIYILKIILPFTILALLMPLNGTARIKTYRSEQFNNAEAVLQISSNHAIFRMRCTYSEAAYVQVNFHVSKRDSLLFLYFTDYGFECESKDNKGYLSWQNDKVLNKRENPLPALPYCPYVVYVKRNDTLLLKAVSEDMREFLAGNSIFLDSEYQYAESYYPYFLRNSSNGSTILWLGGLKDDEIFPKLFTPINALPINILPKSLQEEKELKEELKRIKKRPKTLFNPNCLTQPELQKQIQ